MSRIAVASRTWNEETKSWEAVEVLNSFGHEDEGLAQAVAFTSAKNRLEELIQQRKGLREDRQLPWLEEISVCPIFSGVGRGGSDHICFEEALTTITVGMK